MFRTIILALSVTFSIGCGQDVPSCEEVCENDVSEQERCGISNFSMDICVPQCEALNQPECQSEFDAVAFCGVDFTYECDPTSTTPGGETTGASLVACEAENAVLLTCLESLDSWEGFPEVSDDTGS